MEKGKYRLLARGITAWKLHYWRNVRERAGDRFVSQKAPKPVILFNEDFLEYQRAWAKIGTLEAALKAFNERDRA